MTIQWSMEITHQSCQKQKNRVYYGYEFPGVFESPVILNLHLRLWDSKIAGRMSSLRPSLDARGRLNALLRLPTQLWLGVKIVGNGILGTAKDLQVTKDTLRHKRYLTYERRQEASLQKMIGIPENFLKLRYVRIQKHQRFQNTKDNKSNRTEAALVIKAASFFKNHPFNIDF